MSETVNGDAINRIVELARASAITKIDLADGRQFVAVPKGRDGGVELTELTDKATWRAPIPTRIQAAVVLTSKDSFVSYVQGYKTNARLFAKLDDTGGGVIRAELDYHAAAGGEGLKVGSRDHTATYKLVDSEPWTRWSKISGKLMSQGDFVRFLEENATDVSAPDSATILEMAKDFSVARKVDFSSAVRTDNGDVSFEYVAQAEAKVKSNGDIVVPNMFELTIPVFYGEPSMKVRAFLRYRMDEGKLQLGIELWRPVYVRQALFEQIGQDVAAATSVPLHFGYFGSARD